MELTQLLCRSFIGPIHYCGASTRSPPKSDYFFDRFFLREQHNPAIQTQPNAAMRRRSHLKSAQHMTYSNLDFLIKVDHDFEGCPQCFWCMRANTPTTHYIAITNQVVLGSQHLLHVHASEMIRGMLW